MKKTNYFSLFTALGLTLCSLNVQAMEEDDSDTSEELRNCITLHVKDREENDFYSNPVMQETIPEELCNRLNINNINEFYQRNRTIDGTNSFRFREKRGEHSPMQIMHIMQDHYYAIYEEGSKEFGHFYNKYVVRPQTPLENQSLKIDCIIGAVCVYVYTVFPRIETLPDSLIHEEAPKTEVFPLIFVNKEYVEYHKEYAKACFKDLEETKIGSHPVDMHPDWNSYIGAHPRQGGEWTWFALQASDYEVYDRRMEYHNAYEERKNGMLEETQKFRTRIGF